MRQTWAIGASMGGTITAAVLGLLLGILAALLGLPVVVGVLACGAIVGAVLILVFVDDYGPQEEHEPHTPRQGGSRP